MIEHLRFGLTCLGTSVGARRRRAYFRITKFTIFKLVISTIFLMKPQPKKIRATNVKAELSEEEEPETESYLNYIKNYYGEVHYHIYAGSQFIEMSGNPPPPPPYGGG